MKKALARFVLFCFSVFLFFLFFPFSCYASTVSCLGARRRYSPVNRPKAAINQLQPQEEVGRQVACIETGKGVGLFCRECWYGTIVFSSVFHFCSCSLFYFFPLVFSCFFFFLSFCRFVLYFPSLSAFSRIWCCRGLKCLGGCGVPCACVWVHSYLGSAY